MTVAVEARKLQKMYGNFQAVAGIDFQIKRGECFGILGPNGAGKTTVVSMIYCFLPVTGGELEVLGSDVKTAPRSIKKRLGVVPQENNLDLELTVRENLLVYAGYFGINKSEARQKAEDLLHFFGLASKANQEVEHISGGMKRRLTIARGLIHTPDILILDEPTTGLDPQSRRLIWEHLRRLKNRGLTLILTTHYMEEASELCDELIIMDRGSILEQGKPQGLIEQHVGSKVVEVDIEPDYIDELVIALDQDIGGYQTSGSTVYIFIPKDEDGALKAINTNGHVESYRVRPSSLEDVFLKLTGRGLDYADTEESGRLL